MDIWFLVTTMKKEPLELVASMNLQSKNVIVADQCGYMKYEELSNGENGIIKHVCTNTIGVSINRNIGMLFAEGIIVFADDDQIFVDNCDGIIAKEFRSHPDIHGIKFYCESLNPDRPLALKKPARFQRASSKRLMSAGVPGLALKKELLDNGDVLFPNNIGPGKKMCCGEDSVFYKRLFKASRKLSFSPILISYVKQESSSWFNGYNQQYFETSGYIYGKLYGPLAPLFVVKKAFAIHRKNNKNKFGKMIIAMLKGYNIYRNNFR